MIGVYYMWDTEEAAPRHKVKQELTPCFEHLLPHTHMSLGLINNSFPSPQPWLPNTNNIPDYSDGGRHQTRHSEIVSTAQSQPFREA